MATLQQIRELILAKLDDGTVIRPNSAEVNSQINSTIRYYQNESFWFTQSEATLNTVIDSSVLTGVPSDFKMTREPNALVLMRENIPYPLSHKNPLFFDSLDYNTSGQPYIYTYRDGQFEVYSVPNQVYDIKLYYTAKFDDLVDDADTNGFTENAERLIEYRTLGDLLIDYREEDVRGNFYLQRASDELKAIKRETYNRTSTGVLSTENIVDSPQNIYIGSSYY